MPSPFPGMDPYLEGDLWTTVHGQLVAEISRQLAPRLRPRYMALMEKRFVMDWPESEEGIAVVAGEGSGRDIFPDIAVAQVGPAGASVSATALKDAPIELETVMPSRVPIHWVEIRDVAERRLVTVIEVLSPTNKRGEGYAEYLARRQRLLLSSAHLMEIDLLRAGRRVPMTTPLPAFPYFVFLSRAGRRPLTQVWPIAISEPLPEVPVPLLAGDADVPLNLQQALTHIFDALAYDLAIDYRRPPEPALGPQDSAWARQRIASIVERQ